MVGTSCDVSHILMQNSFTEVNAHMQRKQEEKKTPRKPI